MNNKERIYRLLCAKKHASGIARELKLSRQFISVIANQLKQEGYILCSNEKGNPKFYEKTKKTPTPVVSTNFSPVVSTTSRPTLNMIEIQKSTFSYNVNLEIDKIERKWDRDWSFRSGVKCFQYSHPMENLGTVIYRQIKSEKVNKIIVILPRINIPESEIEGIEDILNDYAYKCGVWFQKKFKMRLGLPEIVQKPHIAVPVREPEIIQSVQDGFTYTVGDMMLDKSPPKLRPEIESTDHRDIVNYLNIIEKSKDISEMVNINSKNIVELYGICKGLATNQGTIIETQKEFASALGINKSIKEDEKIDVT